MKKKDYIGRFVRMRRKVQTEGGDVIPADSIMEVTSTWRGKFTIGTPPTRGNSSPHQGCSGIGEYDFDLLPQDPREQARIALVAALEVAGRYGLGYCLTTDERRLTELSFAVIELPSEERPEGAPEVPW